MSVYTPVDADALARWLAEHQAGSAVALTPVAEGVENTNYFLDTTQGRFVLTLFERLDPAALPFYLGLMRRLSARRVSAPEPLPDRHGRLFSPLCGKPAALVTRLTGRPIDRPTPAHCAAIGTWLANMHRALADYAPAIANPRGATWRANTARQLRQLLDAEARQLLDTCLATFDGRPESGAGLPRGAIHADLFRDNALWQDAERAELAGVIDFYFAGVDDWLLDLAITANDWCLADAGQLDRERCTALLRAYHAIRPLGADEHAAWPTRLGRAALRFWLSRLADLHLPRPGHLVKVKDPDEYRTILTQRLALAADPAAAPWLA